MKIAYVTIDDGEDINSWSGTSYRISKSLKERGHIIYYIGNLKRINLSFFLLKKIFYKIFSKKKYYVDREQKILKKYAIQIDKLLYNIDYDVVFSPSSIPITFLKSNKPIVFFTDAVFTGMLNYYPDFTNLSLKSISNGASQEIKSLNNASLCIYSSEWASLEAKKLVPTANIKVINFGANIEESLNQNEIFEVIVKKMNNDSSSLNLLFVGVDWNRKGGEFALEVVRKLNKEGIQTKLFILGCNPEINEEDKFFVEVYGYVNKKTDEGKKIIHNLYLASHFLILPTKYDCTPIVICEAAYYGLISLSKNTGGVSSVIINELNGKVFDYNLSSDEWVNYIEKLFTNKELYIKLAKSARVDYDLRLNWSVVGEKIEKALDFVIKND